MGTYHLWRLYRKHGVDVVRPIESSFWDITDDDFLLDDAGFVSMLVLCHSSPYLLAQRET